MRWVRALLGRLRGLGRRGRWQAEMRDEFQSALDLHADDCERAGMRPDEARRTARIRFGGLNTTAEQYRERRTFTMVEDVVRDARYAFRSLRHRRGFSLAVVVTLTLALGANTVVLTALDALVLAPRPVPDPDRLVQLFNLREGREPSNRHSESSWPQYQDLAARTDLFSGVALSTQAFRLLGDGTTVQRIRGRRVTAGFFDLMGARPVVGRFFRPEEVDPVPADVIVLSQTWWENAFDADPGVIGTTLTLDGSAPLTIIGVAPRSQETIDAEAMFTIPYVASPRDADRARSRYQAHSDDLWLRLQPGVTREQALDQIRAIERRWSEDEADADGRRVFAAYDGRVEFDLPHPLAGSLYLLQVGSLVVLVAGCFNVLVLVANAMARRRRELAIRLSIGGSRSTLRRLVLIEACWLAVASAAGAMAVTWIGTGVLNRYLAVVSPFTPPVTVSLVVLAALGVAAVLVVGALHWLPLEVLWHAGALRRPGGSQRTATDTGFATRLTAAAVVGQVVVAVVMLVGASLLIDSFRNVLSIDPGFDVSHVVEGRLDFDTVQTFYPSRADAARFKRRVVDAMAEIPGVEQVGLSMFQMFGHDMRSTPGGREGYVAHFVSPGFFATMGIPVTQGRACRDSDAGRPVMVDEAFVRDWFPEQDPIGLALPTEVLGGGGVIVGVTGQATLRGLERRDSQAIVYFCEPVDMGWWEYSILLRTPRDSGVLIREMTQRLRGVDPRVALSYSGSLDDALDSMLTGRRAITWLLACFAALAWCLATVGVYAVLAHAVTERRREIAIRFALGARPMDVYGWILRRGLGQTSIGLLLGLAGAALTSRWLEQWLFGAAPLEPSAYLTVTALFVGVAVIACSVPAWRAAGVDPVGALGAE